MESCSKNLCALIFEHLSLTYKFATAIIAIVPIVLIVKSTIVYIPRSSFVYGKKCPRRKNQLSVLIGFDSLHENQQDYLK